MLNASWNRVALFQNDHFALGPCRFLTFQTSGFVFDNYPESFSLGLHYLYFIWIQISTLHFTLMIKLFLNTEKVRIYGINFFIPEEIYSFHSFYMSRMPLLTFWKVINDLVVTTFCVGWESMVNFWDNWLLNELCFLLFGVKT